MSLHVESRETPSYSTQTSIPTLVLQWNFRTIFGIRDCGSNTQSEDLMFIAFNLSTYKFFPKVPPKALSHDLQDFGILLMPFRALPWVTWSSRRKQPGKFPLRTLVAQGGNVLDDQAAVGGVHIFTACADQNAP